MHQTRTGEPAHAVDTSLGLSSSRPTSSTVHGTSSSHRTCRSICRAGPHAQRASSRRRHSIWRSLGLLSAAGKGADERDARPQASYGSGRGIEGPNPSASQAEAGVSSARLGRLDCWLAQSSAELAGDLKGLEVSYQCLRQSCRRPTPRRWSVWYSAPCSTSPSWTGRTTVRMRGFRKA
jgi:hypothetical protein